MKSLILAAGYATRMYPITLNVPKPLLPLGGRPAIEHIIKRLEAIKEIERIFIVTNQKFFHQFQSWQKGFQAKKPIEIINDKSLAEKGRLGAIGDLSFVLKKEKIDDDLLVVAGDNIFESALREFVDFAQHHRPSSSIGLHNLKNKNDVKRYSQVRLDGSERVVNFEEKPSRPTSTLVAECLYFFPREKLGLIAKYINSGGQTDMPGHYISWLCQKDSVYGFTFHGKWYDIGSYQIYKKADEAFKTT